jgi:hypothetical protein
MAETYIVHVRSYGQLGESMIPPGGRLDSLEAALRFCAPLFPETLHEYVVDHIEGPGELRLSKDEVEAAVKAHGYPGRTP